MQLSNSSRAADTVSHYLTVSTCIWDDWIQQQAGTLKPITFPIGMDPVPSFAHSGVCQTTLAAAAIRRPRLGGGSERAASALQNPANGASSSTRPATAAGAATLLLTQAAAAAVCRRCAWTRRRGQVAISGASRSQLHPWPRRLASFFKSCNAPGTVFVNNCQERRGARTVGAVQHLELYSSRLE